MDNVINIITKMAEGYEVRITKDKFDIRPNEVILEYPNEFIQMCECEFHIVMDRREYGRLQSEYWSLHKQLDILAREEEEKRYLSGVINMFEYTWRNVKRNYYLHPLNVQMEKRTSLKLNSAVLPLVQSMQVTRSHVMKYMKYIDSIITE